MDNTDRLSIVFFVLVMMAVVAVPTVIVFARTNKRISKVEKVNEILIGKLEEKKFTILLKDGSVVNTKGIANNGEVIDIPKERGCVYDYYLRFMRTTSSVEIITKDGSIKGYEGVLVNFMDSTEVKYNWGYISVDGRYY